MTNHGDCHCERCGFRGEPTRAPVAAKVGLAALYVAAVVMMIGSALSGFLTVMLAPMIVVICSAIQAPLAEAASEPTRCPKCRCVIVEDADENVSVARGHAVAA